MRFAASQASSRPHRDHTRSACTASGSASSGAITWLYTSSVVDAFEWPTFRQPGKGSAERTNDLSVRGSDVDRRRQADHDLARLLRPTNINPLEGESPAPRRWASPSQEPSRNATAAGRPGQRDGGMGQVPVRVGTASPTFAQLPRGGTRTPRPTQPLHLILVPVFTCAIPAVEPRTMIVPVRLIITASPLGSGVVLTFTTIFFVAPQPAAPKPRTVSSASAMSVFIGHLLCAHPSGVKATGPSPGPVFRNDP